MNVRIVVPPPSSAIARRSVGYGAGYGAAAGVAVLVVLGLVGGPQFRDPDFLGVAIIFAPLAAAIGATVGVACGLVGGITLVALRRHATVSRAAARVVAGAGGALLPTLAAADIHQPGSALAVALGMTLVTFGIGLAIGPRVLYGKTRRPRRNADEQPADVTPQGLARPDTEHS